MLVSSSDICHNLIRCLDDIWHFGRADVDDDVAVPSSVVAADELESPHLHPLFRLLDEDGDGRVSLDEMRSWLCKLGKHDVSTACLASMVESATCSTTWGLDFPQFTALYHSLFNTLEAQQQEDDEVLDAFHVYDRNRDGFISASELATVLMELGLMGAATSDVAAAHVERCQAFIDRVDSDGNGLVDLQEFRAMLMCH